MAASDDFNARLFARVLEATHHNEPGVDGTWGGANPLSARRRGIDAIERLGARANLKRRHFRAERGGVVLSQLANRATELAAAEALLEDQASRDLLLDVLTMRVLGEHHVRIPVSQSVFRRICARIEKHQRTATAVERTAAGYTLNQYRVPAAHGPVDLIGVAYLVAEFFDVEQYALSGRQVDVRAEQGDTVVDAGGGWGETALYFADAVGSSGRVLAFEFVPDNLRILRRNLDLNPGLRERIEVVPHPTWETHGERLAFASAGGQTSVAEPLEGADEHVATETIDHACSEREVDRVDFIKLDVEGAEQATLRGAEETIRRDRPKLAVSVYHGLDDFAAVPLWLDGLDLGYRFYLDHRWPGQAETILFARPG